MKNKPALKAKKVLAKPIISFECSDCCTFDSDEYRFNLDYSENGIIFKRNYLTKYIDE